MTVEEMLLEWRRQALSANLMNSQEQKENLSRGNLSSEDLTGKRSADKEDLTSKTSNRAAGDFNLSITNSTKSEVFQKPNAQQRKRKSKSNPESLVRILSTIEEKGQESQLYLQSNHISEKEEDSERLLCQPWMRLVCINRAEFSERKKEGTICNSCIWNQGEFRFNKEELVDNFMNPVGDKSQ